MVNLPGFELQIDYKNEKERKVSGWLIKVRNCLINWVIIQFIKIGSIRIRTSLEGMESDSEFYLGNVKYEVCLRYLREDV